MGVDNIFENGTKRIKSRDLKQYVKINSDWIISDDTTSNSKKIIAEYWKTGKIDLLIDEIKNEFLKGYLNPAGNVSGGRIKLLPDGKKLARGGFSIFAKSLKFNLNGKSLWDVVYENSSGLKTYLYSEEKVVFEKNKKAKNVDEFEKCYSEIVKKLERNIKKDCKTEFLALYTLLKTFIRVGNLEYYNHLKHKGLTTLQKKDIKFFGKKVIFDFIGKDGVPQNIVRQFPDFYIKGLKNLLNSKKNNDFVFTDKKGVPLHSIIFTDILFDYTGKHFYPHIIRSHYADSECKKFLNRKIAVKKDEVEKKFLEIASNLGHKKFDKKKNEWITNSKITIESYIRPEYSKKMKKFYKN